MKTVRLMPVVMSLLSLAMGLNPFCKACAFRRQKRRGGLGGLVVPLTYLSIMGAPVYGRGLLPGSGGMIDFERLTPRSSPNEYLIAPTDSAPAFDDDERREAAPVFPISAEELRTAFESMLQDRMPILGETYSRPTLSDDEKAQCVYVERTPLLRFPDVINVQFISLSPTTSTLAIHSGSVYGYSDVGKNKARLGEMMTALRDLPASMRRASVPV